jgi:hypothetical protein
VNPANLLIFPVILLLNQHLRQSLNLKQVAPKDAQKVISILK